MNRNVFKIFLPISIIIISQGCATDSASNDYIQAKNILSFSRNQEDAIPHLKKALDKEPNNNEFITVYWDTLERVSKQKTREAFLLIKEKKYEEAEKKIEKIKAIYPQYHQLSNIIKFLEVSKNNDLELEQAIKFYYSRQYEQAQEILNNILSHSPDDAETRHWLEKTQKAMLSLSSDKNEINRMLDRKISIDYKNVTTQIILDNISKVTGINFFFDREVRLENVENIVSKDNSVRDTLAVICLSNNLRMKILNNNSIIFFPDVPDKIRKYESLAIRTFHITKGNITKIAESIRNILHVTDLSMDEKSGYLIVRSTPDTIGAVEHLVSIEDQESPEVELELEVLEVSHNDARALGIEWPNDLSFSVISSGKTASTTLDKLLDISKSDIMVSGLQGSVAASESIGHSSLLADPRIRVRDSEKAEIQIGERLPLKSSSTTSTGVISDSVSYIDVGLKLEVSPKISFDQNVTINLKLEVSSMLSKQDLGNGSFGYDIGTRNVSTTLRLMNNETQILGGLLKNTKSHSDAGYPGIERIPLLGYLFGKKSYSEEQNEIILAVTPHIIHPVSAISRLDQNFSSGTASNVQLNASYINYKKVSSSKTKITPETEKRHEDLATTTVNKNYVTTNSINNNEETSKTKQEKDLSDTNESKPSSTVTKGCSISYSVSDTGKILLSRSTSDRHIWNLILENIPENMKNLIIYIWIDKSKINFIKLLPGSIATINEPDANIEQNSITLKLAAITGFHLPKDGIATQIKFNSDFCTDGIRIDKIEQNV